MNHDVELSMPGWHGWRTDQGWHYAERQEPYAKVSDPTEIGIKRRIRELQYYEERAERNSAASEEPTT